VTGLAARVAAVCGREVARLERVGGGDINEAYRAQFADESFAFVKTRAGVAAGEYAAEAAALRWLAEPRALRVPEVLGVADDVLVLDWVDEGAARGEPTAFGAGLAAVHAAGAEAFGATPPPAGAGDDRPDRPGGARPFRLASLVLPNDPAPDWATFYAERRLLPLLPHAGLSRFGNKAVESVCARIHDLAGPPEPPARLHGDLWAGNVLWSAGGAVLIDPAAHGGHRETDLAMLALFGLPHLETVLDAYDRAAPLRPGWRDRVPLHQLHPLAVHAAGHGPHYGAALADAARATLDLA
jgi:fructosamine-3-kinase